MHAGGGMSASYSGTGSTRQRQGLQHHPRARDHDPDTLSESSQSASLLQTLKSRIRELRIGLLSATLFAVLVASTSRWTCGS